MPSRLVLPPEARLILNDILKEDKRPDVLFLQEVTLSARSSILANPAIREAFLTTDADDHTSFEDVPFANMTLLSNKRFAFDLESQLENNDTGSTTKFTVGAVSRIELPSKYRRCALCVEIIPPRCSSASSSTVRLINVHLDSLGDILSYCTAQIEILAGLFRERGGGLIAGDFNAISVEDHTLLGKNGLVNGWLALHGKNGLDGATWGVGVQRRDGLRA